MHTIKLQVQDSIYSHIMFFLKNLSSKELSILEDKEIQEDEETKELKALSNHSANLIDKWRDEDEDIFSKTSGLLKSKNVDSLKWQDEIRDDRDI